MSAAMPSALQASPFGGLFSQDSPSPSASASPGASPSPSAGSSLLSLAPGSSPAPSVASVATRFIGKWRCEGYSPEDNSDQTYMRESRDIVTLIGTFDSGKLITERFAHDPAGNVWELTTSESTDRFVALPQTDDHWVFVERNGRKPGHPVRLVYTTLGPLAFRREHQVLAQNAWVDDAETVCRRSPDSLALTTPSPRPSARPSPARRVAASSPSPSPSPQRDRAYNLVGGWVCETIEGNAAPHTYTLERDGTITLRTVLTVGTKSFPIEERYRYDADQNTWTETTLGGGYSGTAASWSADKWVFDGDAFVEGRRVPERMIYTDLDGHAFRRDFRRQRGDEWETIASETCRR